MPNQPEYLQHQMDKAADAKTLIGDYVLATKYSDGHPRDHFFVGFVTGMTWHKRYLVADTEGNNQRGNGFRRAERITKEEGKRLVELMPDIGDKPGPSLWQHLDRIRNELALQAAQARIADLESLLADAYVIKPLKWEVLYDLGVHLSGPYSVSPRVNNSGYGAFVTDDWRWRPEYDSLEAAKAACEEHHRARMMEGLVPALEYQKNKKDPNKKI